MGTHSLNDPIRTYRINHCILAENLSHQLVRIAKCLERCYVRIVLELLQHGLRLVADVGSILRLPVVWLRHHAPLYSEPYHVHPSNVGISTSLPFCYNMKTLTFLFSNLCNDLLFLIRPYSVFSLVDPSKDLQENQYYCKDANDGVYATFYVLRYLKLPAPLP